MDDGILHYKVVGYIELKIRLRGAVRTVLKILLRGALCRKEILRGHMQKSIKFLVSQL